MGQGRARVKRVLLAAHEALLRAGIVVAPRHYHVAFPDIHELARTKGTWARKSELPGIEVDLDGQVERLRETCLPFQAEYAGNATYREAARAGFGPGFGYVEAQALHAVVRHDKPRRVIEVGSGVSTACILRALAANEAEGAGRAQVTCIEPHPSPALRRAAGIDLLEQPVQRVPASFFTGLGERDLLFIDSSHVVGPGSDVNYLLLEVLPRLSPGVVVHVHDVFLPYDYDRAVLRTFMHWSETSLLRALLVGNAHLRIRFCLSMLHYDRQAGLQEVFPEYQPRADVDGLEPDLPPAFAPNPRHFPSSLYLVTA